MTNYNFEISHLRMAGGDEQTDGSGKYQLGGGNRNNTDTLGKYLPVFFKIFQLILCIVCIGLFDEPATEIRIIAFTSQRTIALAYGTFVTFLILSSVFLIGKFLRDEWPWKTNALLSCIGTILFLACTATILKDWSDTKNRNLWPPNIHRLDFLCATGFLSLFAALIFLADLLVILKYGVRGDYDEE